MSHADQDGRNQHRGEADIAPQPSDEDLMLLVQQGDRQAYGALFGRYQGSVYSFLVRRTGNTELAAELFQESFLRVWRSAGTFKPGQPFRPWLYRVAANLARDRFRRETRQVDTVEIDLGRSAEDQLDPTGTVDLERAIDTLPDTLREAFLLGAVHGLDHNEVAEALNISPANARARISRARARLREILQDRGLAE